MGNCCADKTPDQNSTKTELLSVSRNCARLLHDTGQSKEIFISLEVKTKEVIKDKYI